MFHRWQATVRYRSKLGTIEVIHMLEEIEELQDLIEFGPHWDTIENIEIVKFGYSTHPTLTIEEAREL